MTKLAMIEKLPLCIWEVGEGVFSIAEYSVCVCVFIYTLIYFLSMQAFYCCVWFICTNT